MGKAGKQAIVSFHLLAARIYPIVRPRAGRQVWISLSLLSLESGLRRGVVGVCVYARLVRGMIDG
jgi:hypothetical protein